MIYRHNNIFKDKNHALAKYVHDISICVDMDNTVTGSCPVLVVKLLEASIRPSELGLTIEVSLGNGSESKSLRFSGLEPGSLYTKSENGVSIIFSTPVSGGYETSQQVELYPYIVSINPTYVDVATTSITIPARDIDVYVGDGEVYLSLKDSYLDRNETNSDGFLFINGISPGADGNINIKSKSSAVVVSVSTDGDGGTDV